MTLLEPWSELRSHQGVRKLFVDDEPFLALGIQFNFLNTERPDGYDYLFAHAERLGCNTIFFPVQWFVVEPEPGRYDWTIVLHTLRRCRELGLRVAWLWFGTNQGGDFRPAPRWLQDEPQRFRRLTSPEGVELDAFCPNCEETLRAERTAFEHFLQQLVELDEDDHTSILLQVQNEICLRMKPEERADKGGFDRFLECCHCQVCNAERNANGQDERQFGLRSLCRYLSELLMHQKALFPLPAYVNFPINPVRPGEDIDHYLEHVPELDLVAPDYYGFSQNDLGFALRWFKRDRNALLVAEHSTESFGAADQNLYTAIAEYGAIGFDPWAIDMSFGWRAWRDRAPERPFVDPSGNLSDMAMQFGRAQRALRSGMRQVARAVGSDDLAFFVSAGVPRKIEERRWGVHFRFQPSGRAAQWMLIRLPRTTYDATPETRCDTFLILGVETKVDLRALAPGAVLTSERGHYQGDQWQPEAKLLAPAWDGAGLPAQASFDLGEGSAYRICLTH